MINMVRITNLDDSQKEIEVVKLVDIRHALNIYSNQQVFKEWMESDSSLPTPHIKINGESHWLKTDLQVFKDKWQAHLEKLSEERIQELSAETVGKLELLEELTKYAKLVARRNASCYKSARGDYSMQAGRLRCVELKGAIDFVNRVIGFENVPNVARNDIHKYHREAKNHVGM